MRRSDPSSRSRSSCPSSFDGLRTAARAFAGAAILLLAPSRASAQSDPFALKPEFLTQAVFSCDDVTINGGGTVTSSGTGGEGHVVANGAITLNGSSTIRGNGTAGPGKKVTATGLSRVTGTKGSLSSPWPCAPLNLTPLAQTLAASNDNARIPRTSTGRNPLSGSSPPDLTLGGNETLALPAGAYYLRNVAINGGSSVSVTGEVRILSTGTVIVNGTSSLNGAGNPALLRLFTSGPAVTLNGSSTLKGFVYAGSPTASITIDGGSVLTGGAYGGRFTMNGRAWLTRDAVVTNPTDPLGLSVTESGQPLVDGAVFSRAVTPVVATTGGRAPVVVTATLDGAAWSSGTSISANGEHVLSVVAADAGTPPQQLTLTRRFTLDTQGPAIVVVAPPAGSLVAASPVVVSGTAGDAISLTLYGVPVVLGPGGAFTATVPLVEGTNLLPLLARDTAGNETTWTHPVVLDTLPPVLSVTAPASGACLAAGTSVTVSGRVADAHPRVAGAPEGAAVSVTLTLPSGNATTLPATVDASGTFAASFPIPETADGRATLLVSAMDSLGHSSRALATLRVDASTPELALTLDGAPFPGAGAGATPPQGSSPALLNRALSARASIRDGAAAPPPVMLTLDGDPYVEATPIAAEGTHLLVARTRDCAAHEAVVHASFAIDTTPPTLISTTPGAGALLKDPVTTFAGTASPDVGAVRVGGRDAVVTPGTDAVSFSFVPFPWQEGENSVSVELVDRAGNRATVMRSFTVKTTGPVVEILLGDLPLGTGRTFFSAVTPEIRTSEPLTGTGAATLTVTVDGAAYVLGTPISGAGAHALEARVLDVAGREARAHASFSIDTASGPSVSITSPPDGATLPGPTADVAGAVSIARASGATAVKVNGRAAVVSGATWSLPGLPLEPDGPNELVAVAVDALGRTASAAVQVVVRSGGPKVVLISPAEGARTNRRKIDLVGAVVGGADATVDGLVRAGALSAAIDATGAFRVLDVPLDDGPNALTVTANDAHGRTGSASVSVVADSTAPSVSFSAAGHPLADGASFPGPVTVTVAVSDAGGAAPAPRILLNGASVSASSPSTDVSIPEAGGWVLSVVAVDTAGNETRASRSIVVGGGGCSLVDIRPADGSTTPDGKVTIVGKSGTSRRVVVRVPQAGGGMQEYVAATADGTFAAGDVPLPVVGENALELACEAAAGSPAATWVRITRLSDEGPQISISSPVAGALVATARTPASGTLSDVAADLYFNGVKVDAAARAGTAFTVPGVALTEGPNVLVARGVDRAGRAGESRVVVARDSQAPRVTLTWPTSGARFGRRGDSPPVADVTGFVDIGSEAHLQSVVASSIAGSGSTVGSSPAIVDPTGAFRAEGLPLGAASGTLRIRVTATDAAGLSTTVESEVVVDAGGPALRLDAPSDLVRLTNSSAPSIPIAGETWATEGAAVSVNGISLDPATLTWDAPASDGRRHVSFSTSAAAPTQDGTVGLIVRVEDLSGRAASVRRLVVRDTTAPEVVEVVPVSGSTGTDPNGILLVLFSEELSKPSLVAPGGFVVTRDGLGEPIVGTFSIAGSAVAFVPGAGLTPGASYRVSLGTGLTDVAGNALATPFESSFTVAPAVTGVSPVLEPPPPAVVCASGLELRGTAPAGATLRATDGAVSVGATADASGRFLLSLPLVGNGYHDVSIRVLGRDGTSSPGVHALVRKDCSAPFVERAELDRTSGRLTVLFSEPMSSSTLSLSAAAGDGASLLLSLESDPTAAPRPGAVSLEADGKALRVDLPTATDAWWRDEAVRLTLRAPAADERGNVVAAPFVTTFFPGAGPGDLSGGFLSGEAYDDATGRPLDGVETRLYLSSAVLPGAVGSPDVPGAVSTTDVRGRYGFFGDVVAGRYALHLARDGYTQAVRRLPLAPGSGAVPFDVRLTPLATAASSRLDPTTGGTFGGPATSGLLLEAAPNAFVVPPSGSLAVRLTPVSAQALPELLPLGWSALAAADVRLESDGANPAPLPQSALFAPAAVHLTLPIPARTPGAVPLVAVRHDFASGRWLTLGPVERRAGSGDADVARIALASPGAVAIVLADVDTAIAPPSLAPGEGQPLTASNLPSPVPPLGATLALDPPVVAPAGRTTARVVARSADGAAKWPSGLAVQAYLDEKLVLSSGGELYEAPFAVDLVLAHEPISPTEVGAASRATVGALSFSVSPSPKASEVVLESGWENVRLYPFPESLERGSVLGGLGGTVTSPNGVELTLPEGALAESVAVEAKLLTPAELWGLTPVAGYRLVAAVRVSFSGRALARAATLSVPLPSDAPDAPAAESRLLLAQLVPSAPDGRGAFARLTARASRLAGPRALAAPEAAGSPLPLEGLLSEGTYLVLRAETPLGFATGFVRIGSGSGLADSRVSTPSLGTADLSRPGGRYAVPVPAAADRAVVALHPCLDEAATGRIASLVPGAVVNLDLLVRPVGPRVVTVQPADGATAQPITSPLVVRFSEPIDPASVTPGLLTAELLADDGTPTGALFSGTLALQADGATLAFTPAHPFPAGRRVRGRLTSGVRDAGGTPYEGALPYLWSFTTSSQIATGGQIDLAKIRLLLPEDGTARIVGVAGAVPAVPAGQTPWSVVPSVENATLTAACATTSTSVDSSGAFSVLAGCASTPVTPRSRVFLKVVDPAGNVTVLPLGPYVTEDGLGFVAPVGQKTVYTTPEGIEVTVPAGAFETPNLVKVSRRDPGTLGVTLPGYLEVGAFVDVDFDGDARETLRFRVPITTSAPVGTLVFAGTPIDLPWGRKLRLIDLARIVDGGGGAKVVSNAEGDQPVVAQQAAPGIGAPGLRTLALPASVLKTALLEFTRRATAAFFHGQGVELAAAVGHVEPAVIGSTTAVFYNEGADACIYAPVPHDWEGHYVLPSIVGSTIGVVLREIATGWILGRNAWDPASGGANGVRDLGELPRPSSAEAPRPPTLVEARPLDVIRFHALDTKDDRRCERLRLELEACTEAGLVEVGAVPGFSLSRETTLQLAVRRFDGEGKALGGQSAQAAVDASGALSRALVVPASTRDELSLIVAPGDVEPEALSAIRLVFDRNLEAIPEAQLACSPAATNCAAELLDLGETGAPVTAGVRVPLGVEQSPDRTALLVEPQATLPRGHSFTFRLRAESLVVHNSPGKTPTGFVYPGYAPSSFSFATRPQSGREIGSVGPGEGGLSLGDTNVARDIVRLGNLLFASSATGRLLAFDTSDITRQAPPSPRPFARANLVADEVRSLATDGHGRVFFAAKVGGSWTVRAFAIETARRASSGSCPSGDAPAWAAGVPCFDPAPGGVKVAFAPGSASGLTASEFLGLTGGLPTGIPSDLDVLVTDETNPPNPDRLATGDDSPKDLDVRAFNARYGVSAQLPPAEPDGSWVLELKLESTHRRRPGVVLRDPGNVCGGEKAWDHYQRVSVDNVTTGQTFSFDIRNEWDGSSGEPGGGPDGELTIDRSHGIRVRPGDRLRVRYNLRTLGYVAVVGGGISAVDLNRFYRAPAPEGAQMGASQCGRLLAREEGASFAFPRCPSPSNPSSTPGSPEDDGGPVPDGLLMTPSLAALVDAGGESVLFSTLLRVGPVRSTHAPATVAPPAGPIPPSFDVVDALCVRPRVPPFSGLSITLRDVVAARAVAWIDRQGRYDTAWTFRAPQPGAERETEIRSDLVFYSVGSAGVLSFALVDGPLGRLDPIGRFYRKDHPVSRLAVDPSGRFLLAGGTTADANPEPFIDVWDLTRVNGVPDSPGYDGYDPRLVASLAAPWDAGHVVFDESGSGLLYTWGSDGTGGRAVPIHDPQFVLAGLYRPEEDPAEGQPLVPVSRVTTRFAPLGVPLRVAAADEADAALRKEIDRVATAAFRVRVSLPGDLGGEGDLLAKVQALRALPDARNLGREEIGAAVGVPGGPGWPKNEVFVTLHRVGGRHVTDASDSTGGSGRLSLLFNEYESREVVVLLADPRARGGYARQKTSDPSRAELDEESQCRRCERPAHVQALVEQGLLAEGDVRELLAAGPYVRVLLSTTPLDPDVPAASLPEAPKAATEKVLLFFSSVNAAGDVYRPPAGGASLFGWADEVPSLFQVALGEPALNHAVLPLEAGGSVLLGSGEAQLSTTDHVVEGRGLGFAAERVWRSGLLGYGPLGSAGFTSPLFAHLREIPALLKPKGEGESGSRTELLYPGEVQYHDGEGRVFRFYPPCDQALCPPGYVAPATTSGPLDPPQTRSWCPAGYEADDNGSYCVPKGLYLRLEKRGVGWRLVSSEHDTAEFDEAGRLTCLSDRHRQGVKDSAARGNSLQLRHDGFGQLTAAEDDYGRRYRFAYLDDPRPTGDGKRYGLLKRLDDFALRSVEYEFHSEDRTLRKVLLPGFSNSSYGLSYTGERRPALEYSYSAPARDSGAPLNGPDFAKLMLTGFTAPREPGRTSVPERLSFRFDTSTGRVVEASVPGPSSGTTRPRWTFDDVPGAGSGSDPDRVLVTQPWGHVVTHELLNGRVTAVEEDAPVLADSDSSPGPDLVVPVRRVRAEFTFAADGRLTTTKRPEGSLVFNEYWNDAPDRLARANVTKVTEGAGTAPRGLADYSETTTRLDYTDATQPAGFPADNIPVKLTDPLLRVSRPMVAAAALAGVASGYDAAPDRKQLQAIRAATEYDAFGRMKAFSGGPGLPNPLSFSASYGKDARGNPGGGFAKEISQGSIRESFEYDDDDEKAFRGNVTRRTTSFGTFSSTKYDEWDRPIEETTGLSTSAAYEPVVDARSRRAFDAAGRLVLEARVQAPLGEVETRISYNDRDQVDRVVETKRAGEEPGMASGVDAETLYAYDAFGRLKSIRSPQGVVTTYVYDAAGRLSGQQTGNAGPRERAYDAAGRPAAVTDGDQGVFRTRYDAWGRPWAEDHPTGARVERRFDAAGGIVKESTYDRADEATRALLAETETNVTSFGEVNEIAELLTAVPRTHRLTRRIHDEAGRLVAITSGPGEAIQRRDLAVSYDTAGRPVEVTDAAGNRSHHLYESEAPWPSHTERYETVPGLPAPVRTTTRTYKRDALGRVVEEDRGNGTVVTTRLDQAGNVTASQLGLEAPTLSTFDGAGRLVRVDRPAGRGFTVYGYDRDGRLRVRVAAGQERTDRSEYRYEDLTGRLRRTEHPDGTSQEFTYNPDDTVDLWTKRSGIQLKHVYDPANRLLGRRIAQTGGAGAPQTDSGDSFGWDPLSRLVLAERPASNTPAVAYSGLDSAGRPKNEIVGGRPPFTRTWDTWSREAEIRLPAGVGAHAAGDGYRRAFDDLDRATGLSGIQSASLGATFSWGGTSRLYGQVTNGPLHAAHRYSFLGSGRGPQPEGGVTSPWRLGVLSVGSSFTPTLDTDAPSHAWGQAAFGYRPQSGLKVGRRVASSPSLLSGQGWAWGLDASRRLSWAEPGRGTLAEDEPTSTARFEVTYGPGDEILGLTRLDSGEVTTQAAGRQGRILSRNGVAFTYDAEGHRTADDRYEYSWNWRDELVSVTVKPCWTASPTDFTSEPSAACLAGQVRPQNAGQQTRYLRDALGRVYSERRLGPPAVPDDDASRPFLEEKEFLWDGGTLLSEAGRAADGTLLWRKSYVPGPSGLDDAVQLRVERYDLAGKRASDRLFSYVRDEQGSVLAIVEEEDTPDPARPGVLLRNIYDPWGQAHAEVGPELRAASFEPDELTLPLPGGSTARQNVDPVTATGGRLRLALSVAADEATLSTGLLVERRLSDGSWGALTAAELALARDPATPEEALALPLQGWQKGVTYRVRLSTAFRDTLGRAPSNQPSVEIPIRSDGSPIAFERRFPVSYETFLAAGETANDALPGGQSLLWQGAWTSSLGGHQLKRARVFDPRTASFLSEDPLDDIDSPNLYGYVAGRPHEAVDPWGLCAFGLPCPGFVQRGIDSAADGVVAAASAAGAGVRQLGRAGGASVDSLDRWGRDVARAAKIAVAGKSGGYTPAQKDWAARTYLRSFVEVLAVGEAAAAPRSGPAPAAGDVAAGPVRAPNPRHLSQVGDPAELDGLLTKLGERAVRHGESLRTGGMAGREAGNAAEELLERYAGAVNERLSRYDSPFTVEWQPATLEGTGRVPPFVQSRSGRIFPYPDSLRLDMSLSDTRVLTTTPEVSTDVYPTILRGYDITLDGRKIDAAVKYEEAFGVPVTDIRPRR